MIKLFFLDHPEQVSWVIENKEAVVSPGTLVLAMSSRVGERLRQAGVPYRIPEEFIAPAELTRRGMENFKWLERFCHYSDRWLAAHLERIRLHALTPTAWNYSALKNIFDPFFLRTLEVKAILESQRPEEVVYFEVPAVAALDDYVDNRESLSAAVLPRVADRLKIAKLSPLPAVESAPSGEGRRVDLRGYARRFFWARWARTLQKYYGAAGFLPAALSGFRKKDCVLALNVDYDLFPLFREASARRTFRVLFWEPGSEHAPRFLCPPAVFPAFRGKRPDRRFMEETSVDWKRLTDDKEYRSFFVIDGVDIFPAVEKQLRHFYEDILRRSVWSFFEAERVLDKFRPRAVVTECLSRPQDAAVFEAARRRQIPRVIYSHGPYGMPSTPVTDYLDYKRTDYFLAWGEGGRKDVERYPAPNPRVEVVGSGALDALKERPRLDARGRAALCRSLGLEPGRRTVIHVLGPISENGYRVGVDFNDRDYFTFDVEKKIVKAFQKFPEAQFLLKLFPFQGMTDPIVDFARHEGFRNLRFVKWTPFVKLLDLADLVVVEVYSTPLMEALAAGKPIVMFTGQESPLESLGDVSEAVHFAGNTDQLERLLRSFLRGDPAAFPRKNGEAFLRKYGTHLNDGRSAQRALEALKTIALGQEG